MAVKKKEITEPENKNTAAEAVNPPTGASKQTAGINTAEIKKNVAQSATGAQKQFIYIGPSVPRGKLQKYAIFAGTRKEVEAYLDDVLEKYPKINNLLVPIEELAKSREKAETPGNALNRYYVELASELRS